MNQTLTRYTIIRVRLNNGKLVRRRVTNIVDRIDADGRISAIAYREGNRGTIAYRITERDAEGPIWSVWS